MILIYFFIVIKRKKVRTNKNKNKQKMLVQLTKQEQWHVDFMKASENYFNDFVTIIEQALQSKPNGKKLRIAHPNGSYNVCRKKIPRDVFHYGKRCGYWKKRDRSMWMPGEMPFERLQRMYASRNICLVDESCSGKSFTVIINLYIGDTPEPHWHDEWHGFEKPYH